MNPMSEPRLVFRTRVFEKYGNEVTRDIMNMFDSSFCGYDIVKQETALQVYNNDNWEALKMYIATKEFSGKSEASMYNVKMLMRQFLTAYNFKKLNEITADDIRGFLCAYQYKRHISDRTKDGYRTKICGFFKWCCKEGIIDKDPGLNVEKIKYEVTQRHALSDEEKEILRAVPKTPRDNAIIEFLISTGCRVSEILLIEKNKINWYENRVEVLGKGKKRRMVYVSARAAVALKAYLNTRKDDSPYLFVSYKAPYHALSRVQIESIIKKYKELAGITSPLTPHILRHTTATSAVKHGMPIQQVSRMLGHEKIETTMIYTDVDDDEVAMAHRRYVE